MKLVIHDPGWPLYLPQIQEALATPWNIVANSYNPVWLTREIADADALLALTLPPEVRHAAGQLTALLFPGAGVLHSNPQELPAGCALCNVYEHEIPIAEYVMMVILMHVTQVNHYGASFRRGCWNGNGRLGSSTHDEACGKTLGIIGYGHIGQAVAARASAFGMNVRAVRKAPDISLPADAVMPDLLGGPSDLLAVLETSDFVLIACPLDESTRGMIGQPELAFMQPHAMLINVSRAEIVQEEPLYDALRNRRIAAAALDVWYRYPVSSSQIMHGSRLPFHELPNVLVTPHFSGWTAPMVKRRMLAIARNLDRLARGQSLERVVLTGTWEPRPCSA